jgi:solute carrier family 25 (mitochondrial carnitine/acylcarnitine transporter), member 20/29
MSADFWAGYISGAAGIIIGNPLDLIKTRLQASPSAEIRASSPASLFSVFDSASTLVRGTTAPVLTYGALNALLFVTYNRSLALLETYNPGYTYSNIYLAGVVGGLGTFVVSTPTEIIKVRSQTAAAGGRGGDTSSVKIVKDIWCREGVQGFYRGGTVTVLRDSIGYGFYFVAYSACKRLLTPAPQHFAPPQPIEEDLSAWRILLAGGIAGMISWTSIFPLDVIKTRLQTLAESPRPASPIPAASPPSIPSQHTPLLTSSEPAMPSSRPESIQSKISIKPTSVSAVEAALQVYRNEGMSVFFRGLAVCNVRAFIVNAVQWAVYEWTMRLLTEKGKL